MRVLTRILPWKGSDVGSCDIQALMECIHNPPCQSWFAPSENGIWCPWSCRAALVFSSSQLRSSRTFSLQECCDDRLPCAAAAAAKSLQSCPTLCDPIDRSPPDFPAPGILQARTPEWVAISFSHLRATFYLFRNTSKVLILFGLYLFIVPLYVCIVPL